MVRKLLRGAAAAAISALAYGQASAQDYPTRPITIIVPYAPGGPADVMARVIGEKLTERLGKQVVVQSKPGGSGIPALEVALAAPADGYTIVMGHDGNLAANVSLFKSLPYDPLNDFQPISLLASSAVVLVTTPSLGYKSVDDLVKAAKAKPHSLNYASAGVGSGGHFAASRFAAIAGLDMVHIPYDGGAPSALAVVSGQAQLVFQSPAAAKPYIDSGQLKALAVAGPKRTPQLPDLPTMKEVGIDFSQISWYGLLVKKGVPAPIVKKLHDEIAAILSDPAVVKNLESRGLVVASSTPEEFTNYIKAEIKLWADAVKLAGIEVQ